METKKVLNKNLESFKAFNTEILDSDLHPSIPDYVKPQNIFKRHKLFEEALLNSQVIKVMDSVCEDILKRNESNEFNLSEYLSHTILTNNQKESFTSSFFEGVDLLQKKTVELVKVVENDVNSKPIRILLLKKKDIDLRIYHKFNDYLLEVFKKEKSKIILPDFAQISKDLNLPNSQLISYCIERNLKILEMVDLIKLKGETTTKVALVINLGSDFNEVVFPLEIVDHLLDHLLDFLKEFYENGKNEKIILFIDKKLRESQVDPYNFKKIIEKKDYQNPAFFIFTQIFNTTMFNLYNKFGSENYHKVSELKNYYIISLLIKHLLINEKNKEFIKDQEVEMKKNSFHEIFHILISKKKKINNKYLYLPYTLKEIFNVKLEKRGNDLKSVSLKELKITEKEILEFFKKINSDQHTIKEIVIFRSKNRNYYFHRCSLLNIFFDLLVLERQRVYKKIKKEWINDPKKIVKDQESFNNYVQSEISEFFLNFYICLIKILGVKPPLSFGSKKTNYWFDRFFFKEGELKNYSLENTNLIYTNIEKKKMLNLLIETVMKESHSKQNNDFKEDFELLDLSLQTLKKEVIRNSKTHYILKLFLWIKTIVGDFFNALLEGSFTFKDRVHSYTKKIHTMHQTSKRASQSEDSYEEELSFASSVPLKDSRKGFFSKKRGKVNKKEILKALEDKFTHLNQPHKLQKMIEEELENWNLKIGRSKVDNRNQVDHLIEAFVERLDVGQLVNSDMDSIFNIIARNNPLLKEIHNQLALKRYVFHKILLEKYNSIKRHL